METRCKVFTPLDVANQMLDLVGFTGNVYGKKIAENSCGEGNILYAIVVRYIDSLKGHNIEYVRQGLENDIIGYDIDEACCEKAKEKLDELANSYGIIDVKWNISCRDTLLLNVDQEYDFVVGNPPYISYRDLEPQRREYLKANFASCKVGAFDYCYAFIEHGLKSLKPDGRMVYLIPSSIFKNVHGKELRELMLDSLTAIHDYTSKKLFGRILTSSALIICCKNNSCNYIHYDDIVAKKKWNIPKVQLGDKWVFSQLISEKDHEKSVRFGDLFSASIVVATLLNEAFVISDYDTLDDQYLHCNGCRIEKEITRIAVSPRSMRNGKEERIIFPYYYTNNALKRYTETEFYEKFPYAVKYLGSHRERLNKRNADKQANWFEYGRSQALHRINQAKLLVSTVITGRIEVYSLDAECIPYAGIFITPIGSSSLDVARQVLTSPGFMQYALSIGICANGHSVRITPKDIENYEFVMREERE